MDARGEVSRVGKASGIDSAMAHGYTHIWLRLVMSQAAISSILMKMLRPLLGRQLLFDDDSVKSSL